MYTHKNEVGGERASSDANDELKCTSVMHIRLEAGEFSGCGSMMRKNCDEALAFMGVPEVPGYQCGK
jgi:hypothetical protein